MGISQEQLDKAVAESRGVLEQLLFHEVNNLTKAVMGDADDAPDGADGGEAPPASEGSAETPSSTDASPGEAPGEDTPADPAMGGADGEAAGAPPSMEQLTQEYAQLDPEELKMHLMAAQAAFEQVSGAAGAGAPPAAGPPGAAGPDMAAMKSELTRLGTELKKSQAEIVDLKKSRPRVSQNAVTGANATERLGAAAVAARTKRNPDRATLTKALSDLAKNEKTNRIDREKINDFYNGGQKNLDLLKGIDGLKSLFA
jgi:hypothetical protein